MPDSDETNLWFSDRGGHRRIGAGSLLSFYLMCLETMLSAPPFIRRWRRRTWIEFVLRSLHHLLATEVWQAHSEGVAYGPLV
jgi:hypothetical protein